MTDPQPPTQQEPESPEDSLTIPEAAELAGVHRVTIHRAIDAGDIPLLAEGTRGFKAGHRVSRAAVQAWMRSHAEELEAEAARIRARAGEKPPAE